MDCCIVGKMSLNVGLYQSHFLVIIDDHCDIVPFLHCLYRAKRILSKSEVFFVHIDAHADLSVPAGTRIKDWEDKDNLYEILSAEGGIAEFILPMITQEMIRQVIWIRSPWSQQLPDGYARFFLKDCCNDKNGMYEAKVNWQCPYYVDDDSFCSFQSDSPSHDSECFSIHLLTCAPESRENIVFNSNHSVYDLSTSINALGDTAPLRSGKQLEWILDICLDYFSTNNPFIEEFIKLFPANSISTTFPPSEWISFVQMVYQSLPYRLPESAFPSLSEAAETFQINEIIISDISQLKLHCQSLFDKVLFQGKGINEFRRLFSFASMETRERIDLFLNHVVLLPEDIKSFIYHKGHLLLLPHHPVMEEKELDRLLVELRDVLHDRIIAPLAKTRESSALPVPLCVTIATSASDEYTLPQQTEFLLQKVLLMVDDLLEMVSTEKTTTVDSIDCEKKEESRELKHLTIHDVRKEPIEMAYQIAFTGARRVSEEIPSFEFLRNAKKKKKE